MLERSDFGNYTLSVPFKIGFSFEKPIASAAITVGNIELEVPNIVLHAFTTPDGTGTPVATVTDSFPPGATEEIRRKEISIQANGIRFLSIQTGVQGAPAIAFVDHLVVEGADLAAKTLSWKTSGGGAQFEYSIEGAALTQPAKISVYWSKGPSFVQRIGSPVFTQDSALTVGSHTATIPVTKIGLPPKGARYLIAAIDQEDNKVGEINENNNVASWKSNLAGQAWFDAYQSLYPYSKSTSELKPAFAAKVNKFISAMRNAGATVTIQTTYRSEGRAYLMHYAWGIAKLGSNPASVPPRDDVDIRWDFGNAALSRQAAQQMVDAFGIVYPPALNTNHAQRIAIDMSISWTAATFKIKKANGQIVSITSGTKNGNNAKLWTVGQSYGVLKLPADKPHWSADGG